MATVFIFMEDLTPEETSRLQSQSLHAYGILVEELRKNSIEFKLARAEIPLDLRTTGIKGDQRVYQHLIILSIIERNGNLMPPNWDLLGRVSTRITNECLDITRVTYLVGAKQKVLDYFSRSFEQSEGYRKPLMQP